MGHSQRLTLDRIRDVFHLVGEVRELGREVLAWRRHLTEGLCRLTGTRVGTVAEIHITPEQGLRAVVGMVDLGWETDGQRRLFLEYMGSGVFHDPVHPLARRRAGRSWTQRRAEFIDDRAWYRSGYVSEFRLAANTDDLIVSHQVFPDPRWTHNVSLHRGWRQKPLAAVERRVAALCHAEVARLWQLGRGETAAGVPPRQRQVLALLREGEGEKQIAVRLALSRHTVHGHVRELHRRLGSTSRGELLARAAALLPEPPLRLAYEAAGGEPAAPG